MPSLSRLSLTDVNRSYVVLVMALALIIGVLSYRTGQDVINSLSGHLLTETVNRIAQAVERHVSGSAAVLETAFPKGVYALNPSNPIWLNCVPGSGWQPRFIGTPTIMPIMATPWTFSDYGESQKVKQNSAFEPPTRALANSFIFPK